MLILTRNFGQWVEVTHRSGDVLRIRVCEPRQPGQDLRLVFDDDARHYEIARPERRRPGFVGDATPAAK